MRNPRVLRAGIGITAIALALAACGGNGGGATAGATATPKPARSAPMSPAPGGVTATPAAALYAGLDQLLREHVDLTANVVQTAITKGPSSTDTKRALAALDQDTQGLGKAIGSVY